MPLINLPENVPGILSALDMRPDLAAPLVQFTTLLMKGPPGETPEPAASRLGPCTLTPTERELIGAYVSRQNECQFCTQAHAAIAAYHCGSRDLVEEVLENSESERISPKLRALLAIAKKVQSRPLSMSEEDVQRAKEAGANDTDIYEAVFIAAAFSMFNRIVDGLRVNMPPDETYFRDIGPRVSKAGYRGSSAGLAGSSQS